MGIVICKKCGKPNKSHYKFCLSCGAMLTKDNIIMVDEGQEGGAPTQPSPAAGPMAPGFAPPMAPPPVAPPSAPESAPPMAPPPVAPPSAPESAPPMAPPSASEFDESPGTEVDPYGSTKVDPYGSSEADPYGATVAGDVTIDDILNKEAPAVESAPAPAPEPPPQPAPEPAASSSETTEFVVCPKCGAQVPRGFKFCGVCGHPMEEAQASDDSLNATVQDMQPPQPVAMLMSQDPQNGPTKLVDLYENQEMVVGREVSDFMSDDYYASPRHARIVIEGGEVFVEDLGSLNGVFVKIPSSSDPMPLEDGMRIRIGGELLRFRRYPEPKPSEDGAIPAGSPKRAWGRLEVVTGPGKPGRAYALTKDRYIVGREEGDIIFPEDGYVSGKHMEITKIDDEVFILDLQSSNGTYLSIRERTRLEPGNLFLMGWRLYTIELV